MRTIDPKNRRIVIKCDQCGADIPRDWPYTMVRTSHGKDCCSKKCMFILDPDDMTLSEVKRMASN